jgi:hypothetical protein
MFLVRRYRCAQAWACGPACFRVLAGKLLVLLGVLVQRPVAEHCLDPMGDWEI